MRGPRLPTIPGIAEAGYLTNESVFDLTECPRRLLVIGGGPLGCELAQAFCRLGSQVSIVQDDPMFLGNEERDAAQILSDAMARDGIGIHLNTETMRVRKEGNQKIVDLISDDYKFTVDGRRDPGRHRQRAQRRRHEPGGGWRPLQQGRRNSDQ